MFFFMDSLQHYTTAAQRATKIAVCGVAPTAAAGAFGQPGSKPQSIGGGGDQINFGASYNELVVSVHWIPLSVRGTMFRINATPGGQLEFQVETDGTLRVFSLPLGTYIATSAAGAVTFNVQHHLRVAIICATGTGGRIIVDVDGNPAVPSTRVIDQSNINTDPQSFGGYTFIQFSGDGESNQGNCYWSHILLGDDFADADGLQPRVSAVFATANAADNSMVQVGGTPADPKSVINETTPNDANWLEGDTAGQRNSFEFANTLPTIARVLAVATVPRVGKSDAATRAGRAYFVIGGTRYFGTTKAIPAAPAYLQEVFNTNPATGVEFTPAEVNAPLIAAYDVVT